MDLNLDVGTILACLMAGGAIIVGKELASRRILLEKNIEVKTLLKMIQGARRELFQAKIKGFDVSSVEKKLQILQEESVILHEKIGGINFFSFRKTLDKHHQELANIQKLLDKINGEEENNGFRIFQTH